MARAAKASLARRVRPYDLWQSWPDRHWDWICGLFVTGTCLYAMLVYVLQCIHGVGPIGMLFFAPVAAFGPYAVLVAAPFLFVAYGVAMGVAHRYGRAVHAFLVINAIHYGAFLASGAMSEGHVHAGRPDTLCGTSAEVVAVGLFLVAQLGVWVPLVVHAVRRGTLLRLRPAPLPKLRPAAA